MDQKHITSYIEAIKNLINKINVTDLFYIIPLAIAFVILVVLITKYILYESEKKFLKIDRDKVDYLEKLTKFFMKSKYTNRIIEKLSDNLGLFNAYSVEKNNKIASLIFITSIVLFFLVYSSIAPHSSLTWYMFLLYVLVAVLFVLIVFYVFIRTAKAKFRSKLPETYKILNSRYAKLKYITKALDDSMNDFDKTIKKEMLKINDVLKKTDKNKIEDTFKAMERRHNDFYLTLLLNLIKHAHYNGSEGVISEQFRKATEEILDDLENERDLSVTSRKFIFIALAFPLLLEKTKQFSASAFDETVTAYFNSPEAVTLYISFWAILAIYISVLLFMERIS